MNVFNRSFILAITFVLLTGQVHAGDEPRGLLLRRGLVRWEVSLKETTRFVEQNIRPETLNLLRGQKRPEGFHCGRDGVSGITQCFLTCCVDLGEKDTVYFATLWFHDDRFYAYDVPFNTGFFPRLLTTLEDRFGNPSKEEQESRMMFGGYGLGGYGLGGYGLNSYIASTKRWDVGNTVILLTDHGAEGKPLAGDIYVAYVPIAREIPAKKMKPESGAKLPF